MVPGQRPAAVGPQSGSCLYVAPAVPGVIGGVSSSQALAWNRRTCRPDRDGQGFWPREGEPQAADTASAESTDAGHRGGPARSSGEGPVMGSERRGRAVHGRLEVNPSGEEPTDRPRQKNAGLWEPYDGRLSRTVLSLNPPTGLWDRRLGAGWPLGLVRVCGPARFGACRIGVWGWCGLVAGGVRLRCAGRCGRLR